MSNLANTIYIQILTRPTTPEKLEAAVAAGMIPKAQLEDGVAYTGTCRNASTATWHAEKNCFTYQRSKFGSTFDEDIEHPEDDKGYDIFVPTGKMQL